MRRVRLDRVKPGSRLARTVYSADGRILLAAGAVINDSYILKLKSNGIVELYIEDEISKNISPQDVVQEETRAEARTLVNNIMSNYVFTQSIEFEKVKTTVDKIIEEILLNKDIMVNLLDIKSIDGYTFAHSVNVCVLSLIIGIELGIKGERLRDLGIGSILHDLGKLRIPKHILDKPTVLTGEEFEEIKKHTIYGYDILMSHDEICKTAAIIALHHHERNNGEGYPLGMKGCDIHEFARIVAVADVYDALTSDRVYRSKINPHEVLEYITSLARDQFDKKVVNSFVKYVALYPVGTSVSLNTRERGIVVKYNPNRPTRPVVRIIMDKDFRLLETVREEDLSVENSLFIVGICEI
jgi:HD-GYP domain-containing protein (c-di-GMP phosphodiesterase class II)